MKLTLAVLAAAGMLLCAPAHAHGAPENLLPAPHVYGPPAPVEAVTTNPANAEFEVNPDESVAAGVARYEHDVKVAKGWRLGLEGVIAADIATTCIGLSRPGIHEGNPIYGRNASCGKIAGINVAVGVLEWVVIGNMIKRNPMRAKTFAMIATLLRGGVVGWNIGQIAR